jgi:hypothetical protein
MQMKSVVCTHEAMLLKTAVYPAKIVYLHAQINYTLSSYVETSVANSEAEITLMRRKLAKLIAQQSATRLNKTADLMDAAFAGLIESNQEAYK